MLEQIRNFSRKQWIILIGGTSIGLCAICGLLTTLLPSAEPEPTAEVITIVITATTEPTTIPTETQIPTATPTEEPTPTPTESISAEMVCLPAGTTQEIGLVTRVIDGDTIEVEIDGQPFRVRYIGMDTPENTSQVEYFGQEATQRNVELVEGKVVTLVKDVSETDQFDRLLRYVLEGDTFVNYALVVEGYATAATYPPDVACSETFLGAEREARDGCNGFWCPTPTAPPPTVPPPTLPPPTLPPPTLPPPPPPPPTSPPAANCHKSYPTVCIPPPPPDLDCGDISFRRFTVLPPDPHRFDGDNDGIGCES